MMWNKFKVLIINLVLVVFLVPNIVWASDKYNCWDYNVYEEEENMVDLKATSADIDYNERVIKLPKLTSPDLIKFTSLDSYDYVVLEEGGFKHYAFDGEGMTLINSLSKEIDDPLGITVDINSPSYFVSEFDEDGVIVRNYIYSNEGMIDNPMLNVIGLDYVHSLSTFETGELALLTEESLNVYMRDGEGSVKLPRLSKDKMENPLSIATNTDFHIAILTEEKVEHYMFDGNSLSNIPIFDIAITEDEFENPKAIVIDDNKTFILDEKDVKGYSLTNEGMTYNAAFSITSNLEKPQAIAFNRGTKDILIVDEMEDVKENGENKFIAKYFMFDGEEYILNKQLSQEIANLAIDKRYHKIGEFITETFTSKSPYIDMFRIRAFTETPLGTEIEFFVAYDIENEPLEWMPMWKVENINNPNDSQGIIYKRGVGFGPTEYGYPIFDLKDDEDGDKDGVIKDEDIREENGEIVIDVDKKYDLGLWVKMNLSFDEIKELIENKDKKYSCFKMKAVLKTTDRKVTPKIFLPIGDNNEKGLDLDEPAIKIEANAEPLPPDVEIEDPYIDNPPEPPKNHNDDTLPQLPERPGFNSKAGWVYTTTPTVKWIFNDFDMEGNPMEGQTAFQLLLLARKDESWSIIYNSGIRDGDTNILTLPTTFDNPIKSGPMWNSGSYRFAVAVRTWDIKGAVSDFNTKSRFNVLAFERPRIANIVYSNAEYSKDELPLNPPVLSNISSHRMIEPGMSWEGLPTAKAGAQVTLLLDSVGPIDITKPKEVPLFYITMGGEHEGKNIPMFLSDCSIMAENGANKTWEFNFFTNAPIITIPDNTIVKGSFVGESNTGGTTVLYMPDFADGIVKTWETIYKDWQVIIQGRDRK